jgi:hypothetical protein
MEASHASGLIKSGVQGNTAAFAHFDFAAPLALFAHAGVHAAIGQEAGFASSSSQRKPLNYAQASVLLGGLNVICQSTWAHSAWSPHLSSLLDYPRAKRKGSAGRRPQHGGVLA